MTLSLYTPDRMVPANTRAPKISSSGSDRQRKRTHPPPGRAPKHIAPTPSFSKAILRFHMRCQNRLPLSTRWRGTRDLADGRGVTVCAATVGTNRVRGAHIGTVCLTVCAPSKNP